MKAEKLESHLPIFTMELLAHCFRYVGVLIVLCCPIFSSAQSPLTSSIEPIALRTIPLPFTPNEFYFHNVMDVRSDRSPVAFLVPVSGDRGSNLELVDLKGGMLPAIEAFVTGSLSQNMSLRPIVIKIKDCKIVEKLVDSSRGVIEGEVYLDFGFHLERGDDLVHLLDFQGGMSYKRTVRQISVIEPIFRKSLSNALKYFHDWMENEAGKNEKLAHSVKVNMSDYRVDFKDDTVFYDPRRPLTWADFTGRPRMGNYAASIFASIAYEGDSRLVDGEVEIDLVFKTYMLKNSSWVKGTNNTYGLNHEQRHFDIAQLITERLKSKISKMTLLPHNFDRVVSFEFLEAYREMNRLQEEYDRETAHGMNSAAQSRWNTRIDNELREFGVIP
ncbi:MAG TPA: hypothetical protein VK957_04770 [Lunatimonas sp.]|nr:hypothetical protein [Lunatimonas sp.]